MRPALPGEAGIDWETAGGGSRGESFVHVRFQWVCCCLGALAWQDARGRLPAPDSGRGRSPSVSSGPALGIYFLPPVTRFIEVANEVGFYSFLSYPLPVPGIASFPSGVLDTWDSLLLRTLAFTSFACAKRIV